jgi:hypothetical protein
MNEVVIDYKKNNTGKKTYYVRRSDLDPQKRRTTIIVSHRNIRRLLAIGNYGETYNDIVNKIIRYDIKVQAYRQKLREQQELAAQ